METKVSVIVPVYNSQDYLRQCMDSICRQSLREIEIICVNDGSTDDSANILEEYCRQDSRVKVYYQENSYAGAARNHGMKYATGKYLIFWDSDDYFEASALEELYLKAEEYQADICVCGGNRFLEEKQILAPNVTSYMNKRRLLEQEVFNRETNEDYILTFTTIAPWNKLIRRDFIEENQLFYQEIRNGNDIYFISMALCMARQIVTVPKPLVTYRIHLESNLTGTSAEAPLTPIYAYETTAQELKNRGIFPEKSFANRAFDGIIYLLRNIKQYASFEEAIVYLKNGALDRIGLFPREDYYDAEWKSSLIEYINEHDAKDVLAYLCHLNYIQYMGQMAQRQKAEALIKKKNRKIRKLEAERKNYLEICDGSTG